MYTEVEPKNDPSVESEIILATEEQIKAYARAKNWVLIARGNSWELATPDWQHRAIIKPTKQHTPHTHMVMVGMRHIEGDQGLILRLGMRFLAD